MKTNILECSLLMTRYEAWNFTMIKELKQVGYENNFPILLFQPDNIERKIKEGLKPDIWQK